MFGPQCENGGTTFAENCFHVPTGLSIDPTLPALTLPGGTRPLIPNAIIVADPAAGACQNHSGCPDQLIFGVDPVNGVQHIVAINGFFVFPVDTTVAKGATTPPPASNLSVTKTADTTSVTAGGGLNHTYTITVTNTGGLAQNVTLTDTWPSGFNRTSVNGCTLTSGSLTGNGNFTCSLGNLMMNQSATVTATFRVPSSTPAGPQTNTVSVTSSTAGSNTATTSNTITVQTKVTLAVTTDDHVQTVMAGDGVTYTYSTVVSNNGPSDAQNVTLNDSWPSGFNRTSSTTGCSPVTGNGNFTCSLGNLAAGGSAAISATYIVPATTPAGSQTNSVSVTSSTPNSSGSTANKTTTVTVNSAGPDLSLYNFETSDQGFTADASITLATTRAIALAGQQSLALTFTNAGPSTHVFGPATYLQPGMQVVFNFWLPAGSKLTSVDAFIADKNYVWTDDWREISSLTPNAWNTFAVTVPSNAAFPLAHLGFEFTSAGAWSGTAYIDAIGPKPDTSLYNFESGTQQFVGSAGVAVASSQAKAYYGIGSLAVMINTSSTTAQVSVQAPNLQPGATVRFHIWVPSGTSITSVDAFVEDRLWTWSDDWRSVSAMTPNNWNDFSVTIPANAALPLSRLGIEFTLNAPWTGTVYIDAIGPKPDMSLYNFEASTQQFVGSAGVTIASSAAKAYAGTGSLAVTINTSSSTAQVSVQAPNLQPGATVWFHIWLPSGTAITSVDAFVEDRVWTWSDDWRSVSAMIPNNWNDFAVTVPANAAFPLSRLGIEFKLNAPWTGTVYTDAIGP
jgi:uncharacterized repeat protein (TIGR01451 family)